MRLSPQAGWRSLVGSASTGQAPRAGRAPGKRRLLRGVANGCCEAEGASVSKGRLSRATQDISLTLPLQNLFNKFINLNSQQSPQMSEYLRHLKRSSI